VSLTALTIGGIGVANAVQAYLARKKTVIAIFKSLGATGNFVISVYLLQIMLLTLAGIATGLVIAVLIPPVTAEILQEYLPIPIRSGIYPSALGLAILFALMTSLAFAILPLGHTHDVTVTTLFRAIHSSLPGRLHRSYAGMAVITFFAIAVLAAVTVYDKYMAIIFILAVLGAFSVLWLLSGTIRLLARHSPQIRSTALRLAISNLHRPEALTSAITLALGLGLLVALATIDENLHRQLAGSVPQQTPSFFFLDIPGTQGDAFQVFLTQNVPEGIVRILPILRARIVRLNSIPVDKIKVAAPGQWVLRGDRSIAYAARLPEDMQLATGTWWPEHYDGEPLVSFSEKEAAQLDLKIGDRISVSALGRIVTAKIANLRKVNWDSYNMNFVMIFSPNAFTGAPHVWLATLKTSGPEKADAALMRAIGKNFSSVTIIPVRETLETVRKLVDQSGLAIRASASIALLASVLVLAGALATGNNARAHDAAVLKTLCATRSILIRAFLYEYAITGFCHRSFCLWSRQLCRMGDCPLPHGH